MEKEPAKKVEAPSVTAATDRPKKQEPVAKAPAAAAPVPRVSREVKVTLEAGIDVSLLFYEPGSASPDLDVSWGLEEGRLPYNILPRFAAKKIHVRRLRRPSAAGTPLAAPEGSVILTLKQEEEKIEALIKARLATVSSWRRRFGCKKPFEGPYQVRARIEEDVPSPGRLLKDLPLSSWFRLREYLAQLQEWRAMNAIFLALQMLTTLPVPMPPHYVSVMASTLQEGQRLWVFNTFEEPASFELPSDQKFVQVLTEPRSRERSPFVQGWPKIRLTLTETRYLEDEISETSPCPTIGVVPCWSVLGVMVGQALGPELDKFKDLATGLFFTLLGHMIESSLMQLCYDQAQLATADQLDAILAALDKFFTQYSIMDNGPFGL